MKKQINALPAPTFRWLKMNGTYLEEELLPAQTNTFTAAAGNEETLLLIDSAAAGKEETLLLLDSAVGGKEEKLLPGCAAAAEKCPQAAEEENVQNSRKYEITVENGAALNLIQVIAGRKDVPAVQQVQVNCLADAQVHIFWIFTDSKALYPSVEVNLKGNGSAMEMDAAYVVPASGVLDMNVEANHIGRNTTSRIEAKGVLYADAKKIFRGTIDLRQGCKGAVGDEREEVLLMDDEAVNQTIPVILCAEEDVAGNHGASIGRIDEEVQFYLQSRGLTPEEVEKMLLEARVNAVIGKMPADAQTKVSAAVGLACEQEE